MKTLTNTKSGPTTWEKAARIISVIAVILGLAGAVHAQDTYSHNDFRTKASGDWSDPTIWQYYDGSDSTWKDTTVAPDYTVGTIIIDSPHIVTVTDSIRIDQAVVQIGAELIMDSTSTGNINLENGPNHDLNVFGTYRQQSNTYGINFLSTGTGSGLSAAFLVDSAGMYYHEIDGGLIPQATWDDSSKLNITGTVNAQTFANGSFDQTFGNVIWNSTSQVDTARVRGTGSGQFTVIGDFRVTSTGTGAIVLGDTGTTAPEINDFIMDAGTAYVNYNGTTVREVEILDDFIMYGGTFIVNNSTDTNAAGNLVILGDMILHNGGTMDIATNTENGSVSVKENVTINSGATLQRSATGGNAGTANFVFLAGALRVYTNEGTISGGINWNVASGADVNFGDDIVYGSYFSNAISSKIRLGHPLGITDQGTSAGNIQTALREYSPNAFYEYNGSVAQETGDGLPDKVSAEIDTLNIGGLIINNTGGDVTLTESTRISGEFSLKNGRLITGFGGLLDDGMLTLGKTAYMLDSGDASSHVWGPMRWRTDTIQHYYFPVGDDGVYKPISIAPQSTAFHVFTAIAYNEGYSNTTSLGTGLNNVSTLEYWDIAQDSADADAIVRLYWNENSQVTDATSSDLRVVRWDGSMWVDEGQDDIDSEEMWVEATIAGTDIDPLSSGLTPVTFGSLSSAENPLPVELISFTGRYMEGSVLLEWVTASEKDNDYFIVERSTDARQFAQVGERVMGNGTSTRSINYSMVDDNNVSGNRVLYYRLRQVDFDGTQHISNVIAVHPGQHNETVEIAVHPNPFVNDLNVTVTGSAQGQFDIRVLDITGKVVASQAGFLENGNAEINLPVQSLQAGVYMVHVNSGSNNVVTKIMKK